MCCSQLVPSMLLSPACSVRSGCCACFVEASWGRLCSWLRPATAAGQQTFGQLACKCWACAGTWSAPRSASSTATALVSPGLCCTSQKTFYCCCCCWGWLWLGCRKGAVRCVQPWQQLHACCAVQPHASERAGLTDWDITSAWSTLGVLIVGAWAGPNNGGVVAALIMSGGCLDTRLC